MSSLTWVIATASRLASLLLPLPHGVLSAEVLKHNIPSPESPLASCSTRIGVKWLPSKQALAGLQTYQLPHRLRAFAPAAFLAWNSSLPYVSLAPAPLIFRSLLKWLTLDSHSKTVPFPAKMSPYNAFPLKSVPFQCIYFSLLPIQENSKSEENTLPPDSGRPCLAHRMLIPHGGQCSLTLLCSAFLSP